MAERPYYLGFACGLGKTVTVIEAIKRRRDLGLAADKILVVLSPKIALSQWARNVAMQDDDAATYLLPGVGELLGMKRMMRGDGCLYVITHYETMKRAMETLATYTWDVVIADEAHFIKNPDSDRTRAIKHIPAAHKIAMSGTPMDKSPAELWSVLNWLYPKEFTSYWRFVQHFVETQEGYEGRPTFVGTNPDHAAELGDLLRPIMTVKSKREAQPDMPELIVERVPLEMSASQKKLYRQVQKAKDILVDVGDQQLIISNTMTRITRMQQIASDPASLGLAGDSSKLAFVLEYIRNNPKQQMLLFSRFRNVAIHVHQEAAKVARGSAALVLGGDDPIGLELFLEGKAQVLVGTIQAMGTAADLPMASVSIFMDCLHSSIQMDQAFDRIHRLGITEPKHAMLLESVGSIDRLISMSLQNKWSDKELVFAYLAMERGEGTLDDLDDADSSQRLDFVT